MTTLSSNGHAPILEVALDLTTSLAAEDRFRRLALAVRRAVPCDAAAVLRLDGGVLVPVGVDGLLPDAVGRRFAVADQPRLARIVAADGPVRLTGSRLPDPFDGLLASGGDALARVHACIGVPLTVEGTVVGVLTVDALDPAAFDAVGDAELATLAALAGAAMRTASLIEALEAASRRSGLVAKQLVAEAHTRWGGEIIGSSPAMRRVTEEVELLAGSDLPVLVLGETGTGKEVVARAIHARSRRRDQPLIHVNCAALPESIAESELFGHARGAFTGATEARAGRFELADGGTILLDEVGELPLGVQAKLLRALQNGELQRVGADRTVRVDARVLAATNRDLAEEVRAGRFRADLYHRLSVYPLHLPPLRERREDVLLLAGWFADQARMRLGLGPVRLDPDARAALLAHDWPGNVRELEHLMLRATLKASMGRRHEVVLVAAEHLGLAPPAAGAAVAEDGPDLPLREAMDAHERALVERALRRSGGNLAEAARRLGLDRANLHRLARRLGLR